MNFEPVQGLDGFFGFLSSVEPDKGRATKFVGLYVGQQLKVN